MVGHLLRELCADVFYSKPVYKQSRELKDARQQAAHVGEECRIVFRFGHQLVVFAHHRDAGSGRNTYSLRVPEHLYEASDQRDCLAVVTGVVVHLTAASLLNRKRDAVPKTFEHLGHSDPRFGKERVVIAGNKKRDSQLNLQYVMKGLSQLQQLP